MQNISLLDLLKAGVHFGHRASRWYPKMAPYIYGVRNDVHIIDLEKTQAKLQEAMDGVREAVARGGQVLFVGTKTQAQEIVTRYATECGMPYISGRWLGGTFTNFRAIRDRVKHFLDLKNKQATGALAKYTKKEQLLFAREIEDLEDKFGGIATMERLPALLFVLDVGHEETAVREAIYTKVPMVAICDTNVDPTPIKYCIPANDDAVKSIEFITKCIAEAVKEGQELAKKRALEAQANAASATAAAKPVV